VEEYIHAQLEERIYNKLAYYRKEWFEFYGIDFVFNEESYRIINKVPSTLCSNIIHISPLAMAPSLSLMRSWSPLESSKRFPPSNPLLSTLKRTVASALQKMSSARFAQRNSTKN
jgi:hypothetical protein